MRTLGLALAFLTLASAGRATAQVQIDIRKILQPGNTKPLWVSISGLSGEALQVLQFDLYVQGFNFTNQSGAQYIINGTVAGNLTAQATDKINGRTLISRSYTGGTLRRQVHTFADDFVAQLQRKGIAQTKIAFKNDTGANSEIFVSDFDGFSPQAVTKDATIVAAPAWVPGRLAIYYTSYKLKNPDIFYHDLSTGERRIFARYGGSNLSPAVSPDGSKVAMILSKDGWSDLYVGDAGGGNVRRLTKSQEDESSPCWSPDGKWICFADKSKGRRSLSKIPVGGGEIQRLTTGGAPSPTEPDWSPDGNWIAFTSSTRAGFDVWVVPAKGGAATILVGGEDPTWSPNSRTLAYVRRQGGGRVLSLLDVPTKQYKDIARISGSSGSNSQPSWAK